MNGSICCHQIGQNSRDFAADWQQKFGGVQKLVKTGGNLLPMAAKNSCPGVC